MDDFFVDDGVLKEYTGKEEIIYIPEDVFVIGHNAFSCCTSLKSITIPSTVTLLGEEAFSNCNKLKEVYLPKTIKKIYRNTFNGCPKELIVYIDGIGQPWINYLNKEDKVELWKE